MKWRGRKRRKTCWRLAKGGLLAHPFVALQRECAKCTLAFASGSFNNWGRSSIYCKLLYLCWLWHSADLQQLNVWLLYTVLLKAFSMSSKHKYLIVSTFYYFFLKNMWSEVSVYRSLNYQKYCRVFLLCLSVYYVKSCWKQFYSLMWGRNLVSLL